MQRDRLRYYYLKYLVQERIRDLTAVVVRTGGQKPLCEVEPGNWLFPFNPAGRERSTAGQYYLGQPIKLAIASINPRHDVLTLNEV